jgi:WD40 repeat protein
MLASGSGDGTLRLWNTQSDENLAVLEVGQDGVLDIAFSPTGQVIAAATESNRVDLFGVRQAVSSN